MRGGRDRGEESNGETEVEIERYRGKGERERGEGQRERERWLAIRPVHHSVHPPGVSHLMKKASPRLYT